MKDRFEEIDTFLKELMARVMAGEKIGEKEVYEKLEKYGMTKEDYTITEEDLENNTMYGTKIGDEKWFAKMGIISACRRNNSRCVSWLPEEKVKEDTRQSLIPSTNISSFDEKLPYFRSFFHTGLAEYKEEFKGKFPIKLYIPIGKNDSLNFIMNLIYFIENSNIWHQSKLASDIRTDDMVVRVYTEEDARKIIDFVNANAGETLLETNPFLERDGKVGLAVDGSQSFNRSTSYLVADYIEECNNNGKAEECGLEGFRKYLQERYNKIYEQCEDVGSILKFFHKNSDNKQILDMKVIMEALLLTTDKEKNADDFFEYWNSIYGIENDEQVKRVINKMLSIMNGDSKEEFKGFPQLPENSTKAIEENNTYKERYASLEEERRIRMEKAAEEYRKKEKIRIEEEKKKEAEAKIKQEEEKKARLAKEEEQRKALEEEQRRILEERRNDPDFQKRFEYFKELRDHAVEVGDTVMANNLDKFLKVVGVESDEEQDKNNRDDER